MSSLLLTGQSYFLFYSFIIYYIGQWDKVSDKRRCYKFLTFSCPFTGPLFLLIFYIYIYGPVNERQEKVSTVFILGIFLFIFLCDAKNKLWTRNLWFSLTIEWSTRPQLNKKEKEIQWPGWRPFNVERILKVTKKSGNWGRCRKLSLWNCKDDISIPRSSSLLPLVWTVAVPFTHIHGQLFSSLSLFVWPC